ncbi:ABC transporter permease subunit [Pinirhizobacter sp.]|jgi:ABC-2 type transport system permease protein|uniref:ABC transporter permease subunit n=1 Tax=Pinirhizobacter sp. TaxID=2950432 RepID=UPI002F404C1E
MSVAAVAGLELRRLRVRPLAWLLAALTLGWLAWRYLFLLDTFMKMQVKLAAMADGPGFTDLVAVPLLAELLQLSFVVVPLMTMTLIASDRRQGTLPLLLSTGQPPSHVVLGKYLAALCWLALWLLLALAMPLALAGSVHLDFGKLAAATLGCALMMAALAAIGIACSAFTAQAALAAVAALIIALALWTVNAGARAAGVEGGFLDWLAMSTHLQIMARGVVGTNDIAWFLIVIVVSLALASRRLADERGRR